MRVSPLKALPGSHSKFQPPIVSIKYIRSVGNGSNGRHLLSKHEAVTLNPSTSNKMNSYNVLFINPSVVSRCELFKCTN
jgi:hypothetical protein